MHNVYMEGAQQALNGFALRHQAIASNVANLNTPGYVKQVVDFERSLMEALEASKPTPKGPEAANDPFDGLSVTASPSNVLLTWQPSVTRSTEGAQRLDGNGNAVESEMGGMAHNAIQYNATVSAVTREYQLLKTIAQAR